jgi:hypothetical protein
MKLAAQSAIAMYLYNSVSQPSGVRGRFRRGTLRELKSKFLRVSLSHFNLFIFICKYRLHTVHNKTCMSHCNN